MERSASYSSQGGQHSNGYDQSTSPLPPWEQRNVARVPYMNRDARPLSHAERQALQFLWAANEQDEPALARPRVHGHGQRSFDNGYPAPRHDREDGWSIPAPKTAPPFTAARHPPPLPATMPRQSQMIPQAPKSAPVLPSFVEMPPTPPPDTFSTLSRSSTMSSTKKSLSISSPGQSPRLPQHTVPSLPGTMSARESVIAPKRSSRPKREETAKKEKPDAAAPLSRRFKLAMKDIFKREPVDESQFEHISDRHWTDE